MEALERAIQLAGGITALASAINVAPSAPSMWKSRGRVPAEHCPKIERHTRGAVTCEQLRPDVAWDVLREQVVPGPVADRPVACTEKRTGVERRGLPDRRGERPQS